MPQEGDPEANSGLLLTSFDLDDNGTCTAKTVAKTGRGQITIKPAHWKKSMHSQHGIGQTDSSHSPRGGGEGGAYPA